MTIRPATISDLQELQHLFVDTIIHTCKNDYTAAQMDVWASSIENEDKWINKIRTQYFIVAQLEKEIVGFGALENGNYIDLLYVHKDHLRKGIANHILEVLKHKAQAQGEASLTSDVSITARPFFEKNGFSVVKKNELELKGVLISNYHMSNK